MLTIIIVGAGTIGCYVASILSQEQHNVILIDEDQPRLNAVALEMDIASRCGSGTDWQLLDELLELAPALLIALTQRDETNLVCCSIAKRLGYPRTIARMRNHYFFNQARLDFAQLFDVDYFVGPELLAANEILKYMISPGSLLVESFSHGAVQLRTLEVPDRWPHSHVPLHELGLPSGILLGLICRKIHHEGEPSREEIIFPHGDATLLPGDEVTLIGKTKVVADIHHFFGITPQMVRSLVLVGGSLIAEKLAMLLADRPIEVQLIDKDYQRCCQLADLLPHCTILHHDATDLEFLRSEKIDETDLVVASTRHDEVNLLCAMVAKEAGCPNAMVVLSNLTCRPIIDKLSIDFVVSPQSIAADQILAQLFAGTINSLVSLYNHQAEIVEVNISADSPLVGIPLSGLGPLLPRDLLIGIIQNRGRILIADGSRIISPGDTVIVITAPHHTAKLSTIF